MQIPCPRTEGGAIAAPTDDHINNARRRGWNRILALSEETTVAGLHEFHLRRHSPVCPEEALHEALLNSVATIAATATHEPQCVWRDRRPILVCVVAVSTEVDDAVLRVVWKQNKDLEIGVQVVDGIVTEDHQSLGN